MKAVIRRDNYRLEFSGRGQTWNELLRPYFGGPEAPAEAAPSPTPVPAPLAAQSQRHPGAQPQHQFTAQPQHQQIAQHQHQPAAQPHPQLRAVAGPVQLVPHRVEQSHPMRPSAAPSVPAPSMPTLTGQPPRQNGPSQPRTWYPPREAAPPRRFEPQAAPRPAMAFSSEEDESAAVSVEPSSDPATLYGRLAAVPGRRSERDATLAAVWFLGKGEREVSTDEIERHFETLHVFPDLKVVPHVLKHVHRTKMLELGSNPKAVRLSKKGVAGVRGRLVPVE
jgi:hypothetical protein